MSMSGWEAVRTPLHDQLLREQMHPAVPSLVARAVPLGLDVERFEADLLGDPHLNRVQARPLTGARRGVQGPPTFLVNGNPYGGPHDPARLLAPVEQAAHGRA